MCFIQPPEDDPVFESLHNFRQVGGGVCLFNRQGRRIRDQLLYRSSRTDFLTEEEVDHFLELGIKVIIDLRTKEEYSRADGDKILGRYYTPYIFKNGKACRQGQDPRNSKDTSSNQRKRYFVNMMTRQYVMRVYNQVNFVVRWFTPVVLLVDWLFGCSLTVRIYSRRVINRQSLSEWYMDILEHAKSEVAYIMRLLLDDSNVPVLINCAHGKDRTGVIVALILGCLETGDEDIARDYSLSEVGGQ